MAAKIPAADIVFVGGNSDLSFATTDYLIGIVEVIREKNQTAASRRRVYYMQSKRPECFEGLLHECALPSNITLVTTLETNRSANYRDVSLAPLPAVRWEQFKSLPWHHKVLTLEPLMDFDLEEFVDMIRQVAPEYVWLGFNSHPKQVTLPEPSPKKVDDLARALILEGIPVRGKTLREIALPKTQRGRGIALP